MLASLSHRNMKRQLSEYKIFWFSLIGVVALMYAFNSLIVSRTMQQLFRLFAENGNGDIGVIAPAPIPELTDREKSRKLESKGAHAMEQKKMKKRTAPPRYDDAFKAGAVRLVTEQGRQPVEVAKELGICIDTLRSWLKASGVQMGQVSRQNREQKRIRELEAENRSLRRQLGEKDEVIDVLKKSVGILSKP